MQYVQTLITLPQIDRKENLYAQYGLAFPHQDGPDSMHSNVVLDGELVIDTDPKTGRVSAQDDHHYFARLTHLHAHLSGHCAC